jgi:DNA-binding MarR family transcriptional regulator
MRAPLAKTAAPPVQAPLPGRCPSTRMPSRLKNDTMIRAEPVNLALACAAEVIDVLPVVMDAMRDAMRHHIDGGLSVPQFRCLNFVDGNPGVSVSDVAAFMGVTLATASSTADRLARAGYLEAARSTADRRRSELSVSELGSALLGRMRERARGDLALVLGRLSARDLNAARAGLAVLSTCFSGGAA